MVELPEDKNPYVGPQPLRRGDPIYGRDAEINALRHFLLAERIVLLYSPSGAGKSSIIQAGLIPALGPRFEIWGPTRVNQPPPPGSDVANRYIWSAIQGFEQILSEQVEQGLADASLRHNSSDLAKLTLIQYVDDRLAAGMGKTPLLIFDQFEEMVRVDPLGIGAIDAFFEQLGEVLFNPRIWALFAIREDYLAPLDEYARRLPTRLQNRYRIDRLRIGPATDAILKPTADTHRKYAPNVVEELVKDLATVKVPKLGGGFEEQKGTQVEPLQLQVVCYDLWERVRKRKQPREISHDDVGDLTHALSNYYARSVKAVSKDNERLERRIREWFRDELITADGVRNQVRQDGEQVGGLPLKPVVSDLLDTYLVRMEPRSSGFWYELSHDRLVNPVRANNTKWFGDHLNKTQQRALQWDREKEPRALLLIDADLVAAEKWAAEPDVDPNAVEASFLIACRAEQERVNAERAQAKREKFHARMRKIAIVFVSGLLVVALMALSYAVQSENKARQSEKIALDSEKIALVNAVDAKWQNWYATSERFAAELQKAKASSEADRADRQAKIAERERVLATAREISGSATQVLDEDPELALILSLHSLAKADLRETRSALHTALLTPRRTNLELGRYAIALAFAGKNLAAVGSDGRVRVWNLESGAGSTLSFDAAPAVNFESGLLRSTFVLSATSLDSLHVAASTKAGLVHFWDASAHWKNAARRIHQLRLQPGDAVSAIALSPKGDRLAIGTQNGAVLLFRTPGFEPGPAVPFTFGPPRDGNQSCASLAFTPDGRALVAVAADRRLRRLSLEDSKVDIPAWPRPPIYTERIVVLPYSNPSVPIFGNGWGELTAPIDDAHAHGSRISAMASSPSGSLLATASEDGAAILWDAKKGSKLRLLQQRQGPVSAVAFDSAGDRVAVGGSSGSIRIFDLTRSNDFEVRSLLNAHSDVSAIAFSPDGKTLATAGDGETRLWTLAKGRDGLVIPPLGVPYNPRVTALAFSPAGDWLATSSWNQYVRTLDFAHLSSLCPEGFSGSCAPDKQTFGPLATMGGVSFGPDGSMVAFGAGGVWLWRPRTDKTLSSDPVRHRLFANQEATALFAGAADIFATAGYKSGDIQLWTVKGGPKLLYQFKEKDPVLLAISPAGNRIALTADGAVKVIHIDLNTRKHTEKLRFNNLTGFAAFAPDGKTVALAFHDDGTSELWDVDSNQQLLTLQGHKRGVAQLAFSRDGKRLATGARDGSVQVYALHLPELLEIAKRRIHRELTPAECSEYLHSSNCPANAALFRDLISGRSR